MEFLTERGCNGDLHGHHWWWDDGIVGVGHEAGVHARSHLHTRCVESRLCDGVVLGVEDENNRVADCSVDGVGNEDKAGATTNSNLQLLAEDLGTEIKWRHTV